MIDEASIIAEFEDPHRKNKHQQPKEYVTNSKDIEDIQRFLFDLVTNEDLNYRHDLFERASDAIKRTLSRPHPAPRPPCEECIYQAQAADRARKAREDVLKQIKQHLIDEYHYPDVEDWLIEELMSYIQNNIENTQQQAGDHHE